MVLAGKPLDTSARNVVRSRSVKTLRRSESDRNAKERGGIVLIVASSFATPRPRLGGDRKMARSSPLEREETVRDDVTHRVEPSVKPTCTAVVLALAALDGDSRRAVRSYETDAALWAAPSRRVVVDAPLSWSMTVQGRGVDARPTAERSSTPPRPSGGSTSCVRSRPHRSAGSGSVRRARQHVHDPRDRCASRAPCRRLDRPCCRRGLSPSGCAPGASSCRRRAPLRSTSRRR